MKDLKSLLDLMFLPDDTVCASNSKWGYHSVTIPSILEGQTKLVSPNLEKYNKTVKSEELILLAINPINGFRTDDNVYRHQTFLWEIDVGSIDSQMDYVKALNLPYSSATFSGGKSIHFLTVLDQPVDAKTWRLLCLW